MVEDSLNTEIEPKWYILHCYSGQEDRVKMNLDQRVATMGLQKNVFDVVVPTEEEVEAEEVTAEIFEEVESTEATLVEADEYDEVDATRASVADWLSKHVLSNK